jgi:branched-chain amino acid transport system ATP-binding protein
LTEPLLQVDKLSKFFGGLAAVREVSLSTHPGEIHAVIGPNGAGKTTLVNLLSGELAPSGGSIRFRGEEIAGLPAHRIARRGVGRSFQKTNVFAGFTAAENCRLAAQARLPSSMRFVRPAAWRQDLHDAADRALAATGLSGRREVVASALSHGEQRQLEIAMTLATEPQLLLLDEPLAGMGAEESVRMVELLRGLGRTHAILLIEHDMDAVFSLAKRLTVMVDGQVLESGPPDAIRASPGVQQAYLGAEET